MTHREKIKTMEEAAQISRMLKREGKRIVTLNGSFDLFHYGHALIAEEAKLQGDVLIVGVNSDESVRRWKRRQGYDDWDKRPINCEKDRAGLVASLDAVDYVVVFDEATPLRFIENVMPDVHVNGSEYGEDCIEAGPVKENGGRIHLVRRIGGLSSSGVIDKIIEAYGGRR